MTFRICRLIENDEPPCKAAQKHGNDWYVDISTLDELIQLNNESGDLVISDESGWSGWDIPHRYAIQVY